jgi:hypothetical protein
LLKYPTDAGLVVQVAGVFGLSTEAFRAEL